VNTVVDNTAAAHGLPVELIAAIVEVESTNNQWAWNPEPAYRYLWDVKRNAPFRSLNAAEVASKRPPADFPALAGDRDQEWWAQQASWGLVQVMGGVARECGFRGPYLTELCEPKTCLEYGCRHLANLHRRFYTRWGWDGVIAAYNAGSPRFNGRVFENQQYVDKVRKALRGARLE
jgi:hypothetical protein